MSILRPRQQEFVERSLAALDEHGNTLAVAPTGFGKGRCLSAVIDKVVSNESERACVLAHRDELVSQNREQLHRYLFGGSRDLKTTIVNATEKSWDGQVTYAMVPSLTRDRHLKHMPPLDLLVVDEAHHAVAPSYLKIIDRAKALNPNVKVYGVTASAVRGDGQGLRKVFSNVADHVAIGDVIQDGHLVPPKTFIIDLGVQEDLKKVKKTAKDFDMNAVSNIMNHQVLNGSVVEHWQEKAGDRKTVVFASTVKHARDVCQAFVDAGVKAAVIDGDMPRTERQKTLHQFDQEDLQVLVNCFVLTEGFDSQPVGCVVLLRPSSQKSTFIQCVGRGLRTVDPERYPGVLKTDCMILDFGTSALMHGSLEQGIDLEGVQSGGHAPTKTCPRCEGYIPLGSRSCPLCGHTWEAQIPEHHGELGDFVMSEMDLLNQSRFKWIDLFEDGLSLLATGFEAWAGVFFLDGHWYAVGGTREQRARVLALGEKTVSIAAAGDWLNTFETESGAKKSMRWLQQAATAQQRRFLPRHHKNNFGLTRYQASCLLAFKFNQRDIHAIVMRAAKVHQAA